MWSRTSHTHREGRAYTPRKKKKKTWGETFIYTFVHWTYNSNFLGQTKGFAHANPTITIRCPTLAFRIGQGPRHLYRIFFFLNVFDYIFSLFFSFFISSSLLTLCVCSTSLLHPQAPRSFATTRCLVFAVVVVPFYPFNSHFFLFFFYF